MHIDRQNLKPGEHFVLDPRCCQALSSSLQLLNIAYTQTQDLSGTFSDASAEDLLSRSGAHVPSLLAWRIWKPLVLPAPGWCVALTDWYPFFYQVVSLVSHLSMLVSIDLRENRQLVKLPMYRTRVIVAGRGLQQVDGRPVDATTRSGCQHSDVCNVFMFRVLAAQMAKGKAKVRRHWPGFCAKLTATIRPDFCLSLEFLTAGRRRRRRRG